MEDLVKKKTTQKNQQIKVGNSVLFIFQKCWVNNTTNVAIIEKRKYNK